MRKRLLFAAGIAAALSLGAFAPSASADDSTVVPGQKGRTGVVTGRYKTNQYGCDYNVQYRGDFGGDPYLDNGWIINNIKCPDGTYHYLIVHQSDPRYTGNPQRAIWGSWEIVVETWSGTGNVANPHSPHYAYGS